MSLFREAIHRDTILFINGIRPSTLKAINTYTNRYGKNVKVLLFVDVKKKKLLKEAKIYEKHKQVDLISTDFSSPVKIKQTLKPYLDVLLAITSQYENSIPSLKQVLPHVPYLQGPSQESLDWATDKVKMRRMLRAHDKSISPKYTVVKDYSDESIKKIERVVGYPLIVKPAGLAASILVSVCYHREELEEVLKTTYRKLNKVYKEKLGRGAPQILVEQMMEGTMYSVDAYVNDRGHVYYTPPVHVKTGKEIGFDDFFGYQRMTPTKLTKPKIEHANRVCSQAIKALGLRSTTVHIELMYLGDLIWKVIELGPRMGGFRHTMYHWSFGINHILNDILIRIPQKPVIPKKRQGYTAVFNLYGKTEGTLNNIQGVKKVRSLESFVDLDIKSKKGDTLKFAKNGGAVVAEVVLFNKKRPDLLADIRRMEKALNIIVE